MTRFRKVSCRRSRLFASSLVMLIVGIVGLLLQINIRLLGHFTVQNNNNNDDDNVNNDKNHTSSFLSFIPFYSDLPNFPNLPPQKKSGKHKKDSSTTTGASLSSRLAIFYNIYIDPKKVPHGVRIIKNQTHQIAKIPHHHDTPIYYNIIGYNYTRRFCPVALKKCKRLHHYTQGGEDLTLQDLYQYCRQHRTRQVMYLHNKGSYSPSHTNDVKRRLVTSILVRLPPIPVQRGTGTAAICNVQTHIWEPFPHFHAQSNMWLAKCSYVAKLIPPNQFEQRRVEMFRQLLQPNGGNRSNSNHGDDKDHHHHPYRCLASVFNRSLPDIYSQDQGLIRAVGMGRYSHELWIYSHPHIQPCNRDYGLGKPLLERPFVANSKLARHAWFRQPGRLFEFQYLYGQEGGGVPPNHSFFWNFYEKATQPIEPNSCRLRTA